MQISYLENPTVNLTYSVQLQSSVHCNKAYLFFKTCYFWESPAEIIMVNFQSMIAEESGKLGSTIFFVIQYIFRIHL